MEHTNEFLAACFGAYWGNKLKVADYEYTYDMCMINTNSVCVGQNKLDVDMWHKIHYCKLILTPLSEITDEHAIEVAKILNPELNTEDVINPTWGESFSKMIGGDIAKIYPLRAIRMWDYLRSKSYDVGFRHLPSLIEAGIAIKK